MAGIDWKNVKPAEGPDLSKMKPRCSYHGFDSVCDKCPEKYGTDGLGFPHSKAPGVKGLIRLKHCRPCDKVHDREHWNSMAWTCTTCVPLPKVTDAIEVTAEQREAKRLERRAASKKRKAQLEGANRKRGAA